MAKIFVNYRSSDNPFGATLVDRELSKHFGQDSVFYASKSIGPGRDFTSALATAVREAEVLLAIIGPNWLTATNSAGDRQIDSPNDWVRSEIAAAFQHTVRVIPILLDNAELPRENELPLEIRKLATCQYLRFRHREAEGDIRRLVDELTELLPSSIDDSDTVAASARDASGSRVSTTPETAPTGAEEPANHRNRVKPTLLIASAALSLFIVAAVLVYSFILKPEQPSSTPSAQSSTGTSNPSSSVPHEATTHPLTMTPGQDLDLKNRTVGTGAPADLTLYERKSDADPFTLSAVNGTRLARADSPHSLKACQTALTVENSQQISFSNDPEKGRVPAALCARMADDTIASMQFAITSMSLPGALTVTIDVWAH